MSDKPEWECCRDIALSLIDEFRNMVVDIENRVPIDEIRVDFYAHASKVIAVAAEAQLGWEVALEQKAERDQHKNCPLCQSDNIETKNIPGKGVISICAECANVWGAGKE